MSAAALGMLLAWTIQTHRITLDDAALTATYVSACTVAAPASDCPQMRRELEVRLLANLQLLQSIDQPIDREVLRVAARADFPFLAQFGLENLRTAQTPGEEAAVALAMDHPSPGVRRVARQVARQSHRPGLDARLNWGNETGANPFGLDPSTNDDWASVFMPEAPRTLAEVGLPEIAATYRPSMSDDSLLVFTTTASPEKVLGVLAKGRKTLSAEELSESAMQMDMSEVEKISAEMEKATDPAQQMELLAKLQQAMAVAQQPMATLRVMHDPTGRFWELPAGQGFPKRQVGIGRDETQGVTTISVLLQ